MRLCDQIIAAQGSVNDDGYGGAISSMARVLVEAQRFELSDQVAQACHYVAHHRPPSIFSALPACHLSTAIWLEWQGHPEKGGDSANRPVPTRLGCLIEPATPNAGTITWAWAHAAMEHPILIAPIGCTFNWMIDANAANDPATQAAIREHVECVAYGPSSHCARFFELVTQRGDIYAPQWPERLDNWHRDVEDEYIFVFAFICFLHAPKGIKQNREDLARLNAERQGAGKRPSCEFTIARLGGHRVRGHFKLHGSEVVWHSQAG